MPAAPGPYLSRLTRVLPFATLCAVAAGQDWTPLDHAAEQGLAGSALAYDAARDRVVMFGGYSMAGFADRTFEWDGARWVLQQTDGVPPTRTGCAMGFDPVSRRVVLIGGKGGAVGFGRYDTWDYDGFAWRQVGPGPGLTGAALATDTLRGQLVLFGGVDGNIGGGTSYTWTWTAGAWTRVATSGPSSRSGHALAFDPRRGRIVLFGGYAPGHPDETWEWDGSAWTQMQPAHQPVFTGAQSLAWDAASGRLLLVGGAETRVWAWDGIDWTQLAERDAPLAVTAVSAGTSIVASGSDTTWVREAGRWRRLAKDARPPARFGHGLVFDRLRGGLLHFGSSYGTDYYGWNDFGFQTWLRKDGAWTRMLLANEPGMEPRYHRVAYAYDEARLRTLLYGGPTLDQTWEWDGFAWTQLAPLPTPGRRTNAACGFDPLRRRVVLHGGGATAATAHDTWEWDGSSWSQVATPSTPLLSDMALVQDPTSGLLVLLGFTTAQQHETWGYVAGSWILLKSGGPPYATRDAAVGADPLRRRIVRFGGAGTGSNFAAETWEWDGAAWTRALPGHAPAPRTAAALCFDLSVGALTLVGGQARDFAQYDAWLYGAVGAAAAGYGAGGLGSAGTPRLAGLGAPELGAQRFAVDVGAARAQAVTVLALGAQRLDVPIAPNAYLHVGAPFASLGGLSNAFGFASLALPLPADPALAGLRCYAQAAVVDPLGSFAGLALSTGLALTLGR